MTTPEAVFRHVIAALNRAGIPHMLTGSFASGIHGVTRATQDIDLVVAPTAQQVRQFVHSLPADEFYADESAAHEALAHEGQFNVIDLANGWKVDLIMRKSRPFSRTEFERRRPVEAWGVVLSVATIEDIILAKLEWAKLGGSERQIEDVASLLRLRGDDIDRAYLLRWIDDLGVSAQWLRAEGMAAK